MPTDPKKSVPPDGFPESAQKQMDTLLASGLADFSLRELLGVSVAPRPESYPPNH